MDIFVDENAKNKNKKKNMILANLVCLDIPEHLFGKYC